MSTLSSAGSTAGLRPVHGGGLLWTEWWYLLGTLAALYVAVDPLELQQAAEDSVLKHLSLLVVLPAVTMAIVTGQVYAPWRQARRGELGPAAALGPLLLLAGLVAAGGVYTRFAMGVQQTFINFGLYMITAYCAATMIWRSWDPMRLVRVYLRILLVAAFVMSLYLVANYGVRQVYHEQIFIVIPMAALFFALRGPALLRWGGCLYFLAMAWLSAKYTSYLVGALTVAYITFVIAVPRLVPTPGLHRTALVYWFWLLGGLTTIVLTFLGVNGMLELPTGNVDYRSHTYGLAWERFLESPLWGNHFAVEAVEKFTGYEIAVGNLLATHSDVLDLLANGGLLAVLVWLWALVRIARIAGERLLAREWLNQPWAPHAHVLAAMSLAGIVTYTFNPILLQPALAFLVWTNLGMLVGLALRNTDARPVPEAQATERRHRRDPNGYRDEPRGHRA
jgi:hypothetical protein